MPFTTTPSGIRIDHEVVGEGDDLVLVHGITESKQTWDPVLPHLAEGHRLILLDLRGHGQSDVADVHDLESMAADVKAVLDEVGAENPVVVGHSLGGMVVSVLAAITPVRAVVNVDQPLALAGFKDALTPLEPMLRGDAFAQVMAGMFDGYAGPLPDEEKARVGALRTPVQQVVLDIWSPVFDQSVEELDALVRDMLDGLEAPYLALHGDDPGPDYRAWLTDVIPQAELEVWDGMAHYPHLMEPARFAERVRSFVNDS
jgi:pimeloyl-ACP methyl ester carboxylesterase